MLHNITYWSLHACYASLGRQIYVKERLPASLVDELAAMKWPYADDEKPFFPDIWATRFSMGERHWANKVNGYKD
jgi:hypothetical protein